MDVKGVRSRQRGAGQRTASRHASIEHTQKEDTHARAKTNTTRMLLQLYIRGLGPRVRAICVRERGIKGTRTGEGRGRRRKVDEEIVRGETRR